MEKLSENLVLEITWLRVLILWLMYTIGCALLGTLMGVMIATAATLITPMTPQYASFVLNAYRPIGAISASVAGLIIFKAVLGRQIFGFRIVLIRTLNHSD